MATAVANADVAGGNTSGTFNRYCVESSSVCSNESASPTLLLVSDRRSSKYGAICSALVTKRNSSRDRFVVFISTTRSGDTLRKCTSRTHRRRTHQFPIRSARRINCLQEIRLKPIALNYLLTDFRPMATSTNELTHLQTRGRANVCCVWVCASERASNAPKTESKSISNNRSIEYNETDPLRIQISAMRSPTFSPQSVQLRPHSMLAIYF